MLSPIFLTCNTLDGPLHSGLPHSPAGIDIQVSQSMEEDTLSQEKLGIDGNPGTNCYRRLLFILGEFESGDQGHFQGMEVEWERDWGILY